MQVFGSAPPQNLYRTRHSPSTSATVLSSAAVHPTSRSPSVDSQERLRSPHKSKGKKKKDDRPSTAESSKHLLPNKGYVSSESVVGSPHLEDLKKPSVYMHYQHSLNSLNDIIDRVSLLNSSMCHVLFIFPYRMIKNPSLNFTITSTTSTSQIPLLYKTLRNLMTADCLPPHLNQSADAHFLHARR